MDTNAEKTNSSEQGTVPRKKKTPTQLRRERKKRQKERERRQRDLERKTESHHFKQHSDTKESQDSESETKRATRRQSNGRKASDVDQTTTGHGLTVDADSGEWRDKQQDRADHQATPDSSSSDTESQPESSSHNSQSPTHSAASFIDKGGDSDNPTIEEERENIEQSSSKGGVDVTEAKTRVEEREREEEGEVVSKTSSTDGEYAPQDGSRELESPSMVISAQKAAEETYSIDHKAGHLATEASNKSGGTASEEEDLDLKRSDSRMRTRTTGVELELKPEE